MSRQDLLINVAVQNQQALGKLNTKLNSLKQTSFGLAKAAKLAATAFIAVAAVKVAGSIINTIRTFEDLKATLKTVQGDAQAAGEAFDLITKFTAGTTFQLEEVSNAFITFRNAGLNPTQEMMTDIGNIAAGMGKRFDDVAKAVFNATTGEFEMLKQLGIKVKVQGDKLTAQFRGVTTELGNNTEEIMGFLQKVGREDFSGAIEERANTLTGAFSNFKDALAVTAMELGEGGLKTELTEAARGMTAFVNENQEAIKVIGKFIGVTLGLLIDALAMVAKHLFNVLHVLGTVTTAVIDFGKSIMRYIPFIKKQEQVVNDNVDALRSMHDAYKVTNKEVEEAVVVSNKYDDAIMRVNESTGEVVKTVKKASAVVSEYDDAIVRINQSTEKAIKKFNFYEDSIIRAKRSQDAATKSAQEFEDLLADKVIIQALRQVIGEGFTPLQGKITAIAAGMSAFRDTASSALTDVLMGTKTLKDALGEIVNSTLRALIQGFINLGITIFILEPLADWLRNQVRGQQQLNSELRKTLYLETAIAAVKGIGSFFGLPFFADGGRTTGNKPIVVGERGPEVFVPNSSGTVIPNDELSMSGMGSSMGGDNIEVTFNINTIDSSDFNQLITQRQDLIIGLINRGLAERGKRSLV